MSAPKCKRCGQLQSVCDEQTDTSGFPDPFEDAVPKPAPSAEPERQHDARIGEFMRALNGHWSVSHSDIKWALSRAGLAIVPTADVPSAEERVWRQDCEINARRAEALEVLLREAVNDLQGLPSWRERARSELARRAAKEAKADD